MKSKTLICALVLASFSFSNLALAKDDNDRHGDRGRGQEHSRGEKHGPRHADKRDHRDDRGHNHRADRRDDRSFERAQERRNDRQDYYNARGPEFRRGGHIPREYRNRQYVVTDYRAYRLSPPPRGQQWVQVGSDYVLIAIATGVIASIILNQ